MSDEVNIKTQSKAVCSTVQNQNSVTDPQLPVSIFKLDVDCFEELFEWLSLADLRALRRTCKRLQKVVDFHIRSNYPSIKIGYGKLELQENYELKAFQPFDTTNVKMVKELTIWAAHLTKNMIGTFVEILQQIEKLNIRTWSLDGEFYETILKWCSNMKYLSIHNIEGNKIVGDENRWLLRQYPTLEHIELDDTDISGAGFGSEIKELKTFFELNPNIQIFSTTFDFLWSNRDCFLGSNIKIDRLEATGDCFEMHDMYEVCTVLNKLYDQGFHKKVHMRPIYIYDQRDFDHIISVRGMGKLSLYKLETQTTLPPIPDIRELAPYSDTYFEDWESIARNLVNLERVYFKKAKSNVLIPFLQFAPKVKEIRVDDLGEGIYFKNGIINLAALNRERRKLAGANKIKIYVKESIFLSTKFAVSKTEFSLVTLKRAEAIEWQSSM